MEDADLAKEALKTADVFGLTHAAYKVLSFSIGDACISHQ